MRESMKTHSGKPCDICGHVGYANLLAACCVCHGANEHVYCMRTKLQEVPKNWHCETCQSSRDIVSAKSDVRECPPEPPISKSFGIVGQENKDSNYLISSKMLHHDALRSVGSSRLPGKEVQFSYKNQKTLCARNSHTFKMLDAGKTESVQAVIGSPSRKSEAHPLLQNNHSKAVENAKVKFLHAEEVVVLTSGAKTKAPPLRGGSGSIPSSLNTVSKKTAAWMFFPPKWPTSRRSKPQKLGSVQISTSLQQQAVSQPLHGKVAPVASNKEYVCKEEPTDAFVPTKEIVTSNAKMEESDYKVQYASSSKMESQPKILSKVEEELPNLPAINAIWKGSFEILDTVSPGEIYDGFQAHPPGKLSRKAYEVSKQMPGILQFKLQPCCDVWPEIFRTESPAAYDIALYFLPDGLNRFKQKYVCILDFMEMHDLAMRSCLDGVELLIFTSKKLPMNSQRLNMQFYLWGVFHRVKGRLSSSVSLIGHQRRNHIPSLKYGNGGRPLNITNENDAEVVDMEIDMEGGKDVGRIDKPVQKPFMKGNHVQFKLQTQKGEFTSSNALDVYKKSDQSYKTGDGSTSRVTSSSNHAVGASQNVLSKVHSPQSKEETTVLWPLAEVKRELLFDAPPGFFRPVTSDAACERHMGRSLVKVPPVPCSLEVPPGFSEPLKLKEKDNSFEATHKNKKARMVGVHALSSSKKENRSFESASRGAFKGLSLQPQKTINDLESAEVPLKCQQVAVLGPPMYPMATDPSYLEENGYDPSGSLIHAGQKDCLSPRQAIHVDCSLQSRNSNSKSLVPSTNNSKCLQLFPEEVKTEDQHFGTDTMEFNLELGTGRKAKNKLAEDWDAPMLSLSRPRYTRDGQRWIASFAKESLKQEGCGNDLQLTL